MYTYNLIQIDIENLTSFSKKITILREAKADVERDKVFHIK